MASRFASISDEEVKEFTEKLENENTNKKTLYDIKVFKEYLEACDEKREIEGITPVELQEKKLKITIRRFKSQSAIFSVFTSNISSQNFAWLGLVFLYTWHQVLLYFLFAVKPSRICKIWLLWNTIKSEIFSI